MKTRGVPIDQQVRDQTGCRHHWVIDSPSGPTSHGVCKVCGAVKQFQNYQLDFYWEDALPPVGSPEASDSVVSAGEGEEEAA